MENKQKKKSKKVYFKFHKYKTKIRDIPHTIKYQNTLLIATLMLFLLNGSSCLYIAQNNLSCNRNGGKYKI